MAYFKYKWERKDKISAQARREKEQEKFYKNKQLLKTLVPIQLPLLQKLEKLYNMYWERNNLRCPKFNNDVVAVKTKSLLDKTDVYSVSKEFISTEYERTHLPFLRDFMQELESFSNDLEIFDKNEQQKLERMLGRGKFFTNFDIRGLIDEEINYL